MAILKTFQNDKGQNMHMTEIINEKGENVCLNDREVISAQHFQPIFNNVLKQTPIENSTGYEIDITTLTGLIKSVTEQKFFELRPSDYMPVVVGENSWATNTLKYVSYDVAGGFEEGDVNTGAGNSRLAEADSAIEGVENKVKNWAKGIGWSIMDLQHAQRSGSWDLITSKERARKKNYDLGIQRIAFLGHGSDAAVKGLLTQANVNSNTTVITKYIKDMNATEFQAFTRDLYGAFRSNAEFTSKATHFVIPELDYNGLATAVDETYPLKSRLERIRDGLRELTMNPNFQVLPCAYCDQVNNADVTGLNKNRYALYNYDADSQRMDLPLAYTSTLANTVNGFQYQNVAYSQYTGLLAYRPKEMLYFDWSA